MRFEECFHVRLLIIRAQYFGGFEHREPRGQFRPRQNPREKFARRHIGIGEACVLGLEQHRREVIIARFVQRVFGKRRARRDHLRHRALDEALRQLRIFNLFANRNAVTGARHLRQIWLELVMREAGQRHVAVLAVIALRQRQPQHLRGEFGVVEEQLKKIAHAKKSTAPG